MDLERLTQPELATLLCVDARTLRNAAKEGMPSHGSGRALSYVWSEVFPWWVSRQTKLALGGRATGAGTKSEIKSLAESERIRAAAEAEMAEMKAEKMKGTLLDREETKKAWAEFILQVRSALLGMPDRATELIRQAPTLAEALAIHKDELAATLSGLAEDETAHVA